MIARIARLRLSTRTRMVVTLVLVSVSIGARTSAQAIEDAVALYRQGRVVEAIEAFRAAAEAMEASDPVSAGKSRNNACVLLMNRGDHAEALVECQHALRLRRGAGDPRSLARTINNLGLVFQHLGRYEQATAHFEEALAINETIDDIEAQVINRGNLGLVASLRGSFDEALRFHTTAAELAERHEAEPWSRARVRIARINLGVVLEELGAFRQALDTYREALAMGEGQDPRARASLQLNMGVVYRNLGDPVAALGAFESAKTIYEQLGDNTSLSNAWLNIALAQHLNLARFEAAERAYRKALELSQLGGDRSEEIRDLFYLGSLLAQLDRWDEASAVFERSLLLANESDSAGGRVSALDGLGRVAQARGDLGKALEHFEAAIRELEGIRADISMSRLRSSYFLDKRSTYGAAVQVLALLHANSPSPELVEKALSVAQRAKHRELLEALGDEAFPAVPLTGDEIRGMLEDRVVLEYFVGDENLFAWVIRSEGIDMVELGPAAPVLEAVASAHDDLARGRRPSGDTLALLSRSLLGPVDAALAGARTLSIAPDGRLWYLPFELLEVPSTSKSLMDSMPVAYLPSASSIAWLSDDAPLGPIVLAGIGDPEIAPSGDDTKSSAGLLATRFRLTALPGADEELSAVASLLPGRNEIRRGERATERELRSLAALKPRIVHFATHTIVDEGRGRGPAILLTPDGSDDGLLYPDEIAELDYHVGLTVLASCRTALGSADDGRALASLTGAFLAAGSSAVLATLWDVGDEATKAFMEQFYYFLSRGFEPEEALRNAKQRFRSDPTWEHPSLWSAYVLVGGSSALVRSPWRLVTLGTATLAALIVLLSVLLTRARSRSVRERTPVVG